MAIMRVLPVVLLAAGASAQTVPTVPTLPITIPITIATTTSTTSTTSSTAPATCTCTGGPPTRQSFPTGARPGSCGPLGADGNPGFFPLAARGPRRPRAGRSTPPPPGTPAG